MKTVRFTVSIPTENGYLGRECNNKECRKHFQVAQDTLAEKLYCPYCGEQFPITELHTPDQLDFAREQATEKLKGIVFGELNKAFSGLGKRLRSGPVTFKHRPIRYHAKPVQQRSDEIPMDTRLSCTHCACRFQVVGIFGFCPGCRAENTRLYDADLDSIRRDVAQSGNPARALRHAYGDLVSEFQTFCSAKAQGLSLPKPSFQDLFDARRYFQNELDVDILAPLSQDRLLVLRRVFHKRHVCQHAKGIITEKYVQKVPEDRALLGRQAALSMEELDEAAKVLGEVLRTLGSASMSRRKTKP